MDRSVFLELVEIKTKLASLFPFLLGILYCLYFFESFDVLNTVLFFVAMLLFDMATTAINNTVDYVKARNLEYRDQENILGRAGLSVRQVVAMIVVMVTVAALIGIVLTARTNLVLLLIGMLCFAIGISYTFGPFPISRMPLGEVMSGFTMGFGIFFIAVFINVPDQRLAVLDIQWPEFVAVGNISAILTVILQSLPLVFTIANIMLANNLCDYETDISNHRYTLVYYIGKPLAVQLYGWLYYAAFAAVVLAVLLGGAPVLMLGLLLLLPIVHRNIRRFQAKQEKATTFNLALKNLVLIHSLQIILLLVALVLR